jgi:hypothetical protein
MEVENEKGATYTMIESHPYRYQLSYKNAKRDSPEKDFPF